MVIMSMGMEKRYPHDTESKSTEKVRGVGFMPPALAIVPHTGLSITEKNFSCTTMTFPCNLPVFLLQFVVSMKGNNNDDDD